MANATTKTKIKLTENPDLTFASIMDEEFRTYIFENKEVTIKNPMYLNVSKSGGHRVYDVYGYSHYIPSGWVQLTWKARKGKLPFAF